jgi:hypothetical protein
MGVHRGVSSTVQPAFECNAGRISEGENVRNAQLQPKTRFHSGQFPTAFVGANLIGMRNAFSVFKGSVRISTHVG